MLSVDTRTTSKNHWIGEKFRARYLPAALAGEIICVFADGDELECIRRMYPSFCPQNSNTAYFVGDIANMIILNWRDQS